MMKFLYIFLLTTTVLAIALPLNAGRVTGTYIFHVIEKRGISSVLGVLHSEGEKIYINTMNMTQLPEVKGEPFVDLGSITKFITAVSILTLIDQGYIDLHTQLGQIIPHVPIDKAHITVHQLLTHTSGLIESTGTDEEKLDRRSFIKRVLGTVLVHPPGKNYLYSNAGYSLLAAIIEIKSGKTYESYLLENILIPNKLPLIGYQAVYDPERSILTSRSWRTLFLRRPIHIASWGGITPGWNLIGNGGVVSTARGFLQFWNAFLNGQIVSSLLVTKALTPHVREGRGKSYYGYGVVIEYSSEFGTIYWHDGGNEVFSAEWRHLENKRLTLFSAGPDKNGMNAMLEMVAAVKQ